MASAATLLRAAALSFRAGDGRPKDNFDYLADAVLVMADGHIRSLQSAPDFVAGAGNLDHCEDLRPGLMVPGFIDAHIHASQMDIVASYGTQLLDWLERYAFPGEQAFASRDHAAAQSERFLDTLFAHGTTTALAFTTVHPVAADCLFAAAQRRGARLIAGKVLMDRNAPDTLRDSGTGSADSARLIERWHGCGRLLYAVTPRFAITSTPAQLAAAGALLERYPGTYLHTHLAENRAEIDATLALYPEAGDYVDVYQRFGLVTERSVFAHGIHLGDDELTRLAAAGAAIAFCPSSNLFLGSGLLDLARLERHRVTTAVATDVGAGTSFSMLSTVADGYKVAQLGGRSWHPLEAFHAITLGNASALGLADRIGRLAPGYEADVVVLGTPDHTTLGQRLARTDDLEERLFAYAMLGDERAVARTYVDGRLAYRNPAC